MQLVDSHCHLDQLDLTPYAGDLARALHLANEQGVTHFLCVCITLHAFRDLLAIAERYPQVSISVGLHPNEDAGGSEPDVDYLIKLGQSKTVVAIGETGLDYYRSQGSVEALEWQRQRFRCHIQAALRLNKPLIIHTRQAKDDTLRIMREESANAVGGVMHCFTEDWDMAEQALNLGFYISFSGIVTFKNALQIQAVAKRVPLDRMLIETDSPYLAPNPHRGSANEPAYVRYVAEAIAALRGISVDVLAEQTTKNFFHLFKGAKK